MHIHLGPDTIEDFQTHLAERSLHGDAIVMDTQEVIDKQTSCCNETVDFNSCYHTLEEVRWQNGEA